MNKIYTSEEVHDIIIHCNTIEMEVKRIKEILNGVTRAERATT